MSAAAIIQASLGVADGTIGLIKGGQERRAQESAQRHALVQTILNSRMQQQQMQLAHEAQLQDKDKPNPTLTYLIVGGLSLVIIGLLIYLVWKKQQ